MIVQRLKISARHRYDQLRRGIARLGLPLGRPMQPFQTLLFEGGSEQSAHSDSIHMTTYPLGYLAAAWIALEDVHPDAGPLTYYPGSQRLPYLLSVDCDMSQEDFLRSPYAGYAQRYEPAVRQRIEAHGLQVQSFLPRKGDMLIWHANLLHGGSPRRDPQLSRRSLVCHYLARGAVCYHDLSGAPAR